MQKRKILCCLITFKMSLFQSAMFLNSLNRVGFTVSAEKELESHTLTLVNQIRNGYLVIHIGRSKVTVLNMRCTTPLQAMTCIDQSIPTALASRIMQTQNLHRSSNNCQTQNKSYMCLSTQYCYTSYICSTFAFILSFTNKLSGQLHS